MSEKTDVAGSPDTLYQPDAPLLLDAMHADLAEFASPERQRYALDGILVNVEKSQIEATDGHILVRVRLDKESSSYPKIDDLPNAPEKNVVVPSGFLRRAARNAARKFKFSGVTHRPGSFLLGAEERGGRTLAAAGSTDLETEHVARCSAIDGRFPSTDGLIPDASVAPAFKIQLRADLLAKLAKYAAKHGSGRSETPIKFSFYAPNEGVKFEVGLSGERELVGLLMPVI